MNSEKENLVTKIIYCNQECKKQPFNCLIKALKEKEKETIITASSFRTFNKYRNKLINNKEKIRNFYCQCKEVNTRSGKIDKRIEGYEIPLFNHPGGMYGDLFLREKRETNYAS